MSAGIAARLAISGRAIGLQNGRKAAEKSAARRLAAHRSARSRMSQTRLKLWAKLLAA